MVVCVYFSSKRNCCVENTMRKKTKGANRFEAQASITIITRRFQNFLNLMQFISRVNLFTNIQNCLIVPLIV